MLEFQCGYQTVRMNVKNITYVESYAHYLLIHTLNSTVKVREKYQWLYKNLNPLVLSKYIDHMSLIMTGLKNRY